MDAPTLLAPLPYHTFAGRLHEFTVGLHEFCDKVRNLGYWSPVETLIFHHVLRWHGCKKGTSQRLVVDVGAHVGYFSFISASYGCRVASFEPNIVALRYLNLSRAINNYERVRLYQKGVGQADTQAMYKQTDTWALNGFVVKRRKLSNVETSRADIFNDYEGRLVEMENHLNYQNPGSGHGRRRILETVDVTMLDSIFDEHILLMKIDTEGHEANVLTGAKNLIYQHKVHNILVEVKQTTSPAKSGLLWTMAKAGAYTWVQLGGSCDSAFSAV